MSDSQANGENDFKSETKYKQFSSAIEKALRTFEGLTEWHDLISSLARINKVLLAYMQYPVVPLQLTVCKRLTQCLHPNLPSGVHLKTLDVYAAIFDRIKTKGLLTNLLLYSSGLFPLLSYASMSVRPRLLEIYEKYFLPLGSDLAPTLHGFVLGLLPGLEDESEHTERICKLLDALSDTTDKSTFFYAMWHCVLGSSEYRLPVVNLLLGKLNRRLTAEDQVHCMGGNLPLVVSAMSAALMDKNVLVQRTALDIVSILFPFHQSFLLLPDLTSILTAALHTLLKRDVSLSRRLYVWLLGTQVDKSSLVNCAQSPSSDLPSPEQLGRGLTTQNSQDDSYFEKYSKAYLSRSLGDIMAHSREAARLNLSKLECVLPYRMLRALQERSEVGGSIMECVMLDLVKCLKAQIDSLGGMATSHSKDTALLKSKGGFINLGSAKKSGKRGSLKAEIVQSANLLFSFLGQDAIWGWMEVMLARGVADMQAAAGTVEEGGKSCIHEDGQGGGDLMAGGEDHVKGARALSPVSDMLDSGLSGSETGIGEGEGDLGGGEPAGSSEEKSPGLKSMLSLFMFLMQVLPKDSSEQLHISHLSQLLLQLVSALNSHLPSFSHQDLGCSHDVCLHLLSNLLKTSQPSSQVSTPSTPVTSSSAGRLLSLDRPTGDPGAQSPRHEVCTAPSSDDTRHQICNTFLSFFATFLETRVISDDAHHKYSPKDMQRPFSCACQTLVLVAKLISKSEGVASHETSDCSSSAATPWLHDLMVVCQSKGIPALALVALETLLQLVEIETEAGLVHGAMLSATGLGRVVDRALTREFVKVVTESLWSLLCSAHSSFQVQVVSLLAWLHSLLSSHNACEMVILEQFASQGLGAYQVFMVMWQYLPIMYHGTKIKPFYRAVLRMLEGLQSTDNSVRSLAQSWVKGTITRGSSEDVHRLVQPLVKILLESDTNRKQRIERAATSKKVTLTRKEAEKDMRYARYYFKSLGIVNPYLPSNENQYMKMVQHYTQVFDASQILYALTLLQLALQVEPSSLVSVAGNTVIDVSMYASSASTPHTDVHGGVVPEGESPDMPVTPPFPNLSSHKSLLEIVLSVCVDLLCSEYHPSLKSSALEQVDNLHVKISCVSLLAKLLHELLRILAKHSSHSEDSAPTEFKVHSPNFVSALLTLCDIQKVCLLLLGKVVEWWEELTAVSGNQNDSENGVWSDLAEVTRQTSGSDLAVILKSFYAHLLRVVQCLVAMDTQFSQSLPIKTRPPTESSDLVTVVSGVAILDAPLPAVTPNCATASQPFLREFLLQVLSNPALSCLHDNLLCMFTATVPNLLSPQLTDLAPRVVKHLCMNIETSVSRDGGSGEAQSSPGKSRDIQLCVVYFESILMIVMWCLFGNTRPHPFRDSEQPRAGGSHFRLHHRPPDPFFDILRVKQAESAKESFSPLNKQPSTMAWLFGVFTAQRTSSESDGGTGDAGLFSRVGVNSQAGQHIMMLLPAAYNSMTDMWTAFHSGHGSEGVAKWMELSMGSGLTRKESMVHEDVEFLFGQFFGCLAQNEPTAFFSSVSHVWLEWNLDDKMEGSNRRSSRRKDAFIDMLHHIKVLPLHILIGSLQSTLIDIAKVEEQESSILRQKYLLHFLYKYISSTRQSSKELTDCRMPLVSFLLVYHHHIYNPTPQGLLSTCHTLCMLTSILHVLVCRVAQPDPKTQKKERKELQDVTHKLCETLSMVANIGISQPDYVLVKMASNPPPGQEEDGDGSAREDSGSATEGSASEGPVHPPESAVEGGTAAAAAGVVKSREATTGHVRNGEVGRIRGKMEGKSASEELLQPTLQALAVLSNVLAHFIDCVFGGSEKDKVTSLLKAVLFNVWPHLHNHSVEHQQCYMHCSKLLAALSGFQVTRKSWRKEVFDLYLSPDFFVMSVVSLREWKVIVDNLMTQDQVTFRDLLSRLHSTSSSGVVNLFSSLDQEIYSGTILLRRMAFAIFSGEVDQYVKYLPDIQEKLSEYLKVLRYPSICCEVLLTFRVLLLRLSPHHLMAFWPAMTAELVALLSQLESDVQHELLESSSSVPKAKLLLYWSACKLLDTALALPPDYLPHFQWIQWGFTGSGVYSGADDTVVMRLCRLYKQLEIRRSELKSHYLVHHTPPYLRSPSISSFRELKPLFDSLATGRQTSKSPSLLKGSCDRVSLVEDIILQDFLDSSVR